MHNRIAARFIYGALEARRWSVSQLATESGVKRSVLAAQLSGTRKIQPQHLDSYLRVLNHIERPRLLAAWVRDVVAPDTLMDLLDAKGDDLSAEVKAWAPALGDDGKQMLLWWAHEMTRDGELQELFKLLSAKAGYRPRRTAAGPVKRRRRRSRGGAVVALLIFAFMLREGLPPPFAHARQRRAAAFALRGRECFLLPAAELA